MRIDVCVEECTNFIQQNEFRFTIETNPFRNIILPKFYALVHGDGVAILRSVFELNLNLVISVVPSCSDFN